MSLYSAYPVSAVYRGLEAKMSDGGFVLLDGGVSTELERVRGGEDTTRGSWGTWALYSAQTAVQDVHASYVATGCDVISTNSWAILEEAARWPDDQPTRAWEAAATAALRLARAAIADAGREAGCAVAYCINGDLRGRHALGALELLTWRWLEEAPDLVILETLDDLPGPEVLDAVGLLAEFGLPVWVSLRRAAAGMATADGIVTPDADRHALPVAVRALEDRGAAALLINCIPPHLAAEAVAALQAVATVPVGCLPNLGHPTPSGWCADETTPPERLADDMLDCVDAGALILGGCCGVGPRHITALKRMLEATSTWSARGV